MQRNVIAASFEFVLSSIIIMFQFKQVDNWSETELEKSLIIIIFEKFPQNLNILCVFFSTLLLTPLLSCVFMFYGLMIILAILLLVTSIWLWSDLHLLDPPWTFSKTFSQKKSNNFPPTPIFHLSTTHSLNISVTQFTWSSLTNNFPPKYLMREESIN